MPTKMTAAEWRKMTDDEVRAVAALKQCRYAVASPPKRMARHLAAQAMNEVPSITDKQSAYMWRMVWTFRRQIADKSLVEIAKVKNG